MAFVDEDIDSVVFQQIDIDQYTDHTNDKEHVLRMYGVTMVRAAPAFISQQKLNCQTRMVIV